MRRRVAKFRVATGLVRWWLRRTGYAGITLPPFGVYLVIDRFNDERLRRHEQCHWKQYRRMGLVRFYVVYLWWLARVGYRDHPMEISARAAEDKPSSGP